MTSDRARDENPKGCDRPQGSTGFASRTFQPGHEGTRPTPEHLTPSYARSLAGYLRAHADMIEAESRGKAGESDALAFQEDRYQWQRVMNLAFEKEGATIRG